MSALHDQLRAARSATLAIAGLDRQRKHTLLTTIAAQIRAEQERILQANRSDLERAQANAVGAAMLDRLRLDPARIENMAAGLEAVASLPDPVGVVTRSEQRPNGIRIERVRIPLGVIAMIYEARPNVTSDAAGLCLMAGNVAVLRGGSEAHHSNRAIAAAIHAALDICGLPLAAVTLVDDTDRERIRELVAAEEFIDLAIPRGGEGLIRYVAEHARVPVIKHYKGVCHLYVDAAADLTLARNLLIDGKTSRPAVCNALETLLVHRGVAKEFLPLATRALHARNVEIRGCPGSRAICPEIKPASDADYAAEFLELIIAVRLVDDLDGALAHIRRYGSDHTEVIATGDDDAARRFVAGLRSAVIMVNASSRFSDGSELGLGAEIGISTTRLHAYGPMGLEALTIERFVVRGEGQTRHPV